MDTYQIIKRIKKNGKDPQYDLLRSGQNNVFVVRKSVDSESFIITEVTDQNLDLKRYPDLLQINGHYLNDHVNYSKNLRKELNYLRKFFKLINEEIIYPHKTELVR